MRIVRNFFVGAAAAAVEIGQASLAWVRQPANALFLALLLWHLVPIWAFRYFPSQDGGEHVNNANILLRYFSSDGALFRDYFVVNRNPEPNWLGHVILAILMSVLPGNVAEKILLTIYVAAFPLSVRYALRAIRPDAGWLSILSFPFIFNFAVHMGFWNFALSLPLFFLVVGYWMHHCRDFRLREAVVLTCLSLLLYFAHPVSYVLAVIYIAVTGAWLSLLHGVMLARTSQLTMRGLWEGVQPRLAMPFYALLPSLGLIVAFVGRMPTGASAPGTQLWERLRTLDSLIAYQEPEVQLTAAVAWAFGAMIVAVLLVKVWKRRFSAWDGILVMVAVVTAIYSQSPDTMAGSGSRISDRMNLMPFLILILWFGAQTYHRFFRWTVIACVAVLSVALSGYRFPKYEELNDYLAELMSAQPYIGRDSTFLPLIYSFKGIDPDGKLLSSRAGVFVHAVGQIAANRNAIELENYEAHMGYFPMIWRYERNPNVHMAVPPGEVTSMPPSVDFLSYPAKTNGRVDYVLLWNYRPDESEPVKSVFRQLGEGYDLVYTSSPRGYAAVYRRKDLAPKQP